MGIVNQSTARSSWRWSVFSSLIFAAVFGSGCLGDDPVGVTGTEGRAPGGNLPLAGPLSSAPQVGPTSEVPAPTAGEPPAAGDDVPTLPDWIDGLRPDSADPIADASPPATPDPDGVGGTDILWRNTASGQNAVWQMNGPALGGFYTLPGASTAWALAGTGDFDGDERADLVWRNAQTGANALWEMVGTDIDRYVVLPGAGASWTIAGVGDFGGDGLSDLLWRNTSSGAIAIWELEDGQITGYHSVGGASLDWSIVGVADFNEDGSTDIVFRNGVTGGNAIWLMSGPEWTGYSGLPSVGDLTWSIADVGDLNGDGQADLLWRRDSGTLAAWALSGSTFLEYLPVGSIGSQDWHVAGLADFDAPLAFTGSSVPLFTGYMRKLALGRPHLEGFVFASGGLGSGSYVWSIPSGEVPTGMSLVAPSDGSDEYRFVAGTPGELGTFSFELQVESGGRAVTESFVAEVVDLASATALTRGAASVPRSLTYGEKAFFRVDVPEGASSLSVAVGGTPLGYWLQAESEVLPTENTTSPGCRVDNSGSSAAPCTVADPASQTFGIMVWARYASIDDFTVTADWDTVPQVGIVTTTLPPAQVGSAYTATLEATGGDGQYQWSVVSGSLPDGLALDPSTGELSGTPSAGGLSEFTVRATTAALFDERTFQLDPQNVAGLDLWIDAVHLNQGSQYLRGGVSGIAGRPGLLRVVALADDPNTVTPSVRIRLYEGGAPVLDEIVAPQAAGVPTGPQFDLADATLTWDLPIPANVAAADLSVVAEFDESGGAVDVVGGNNRYPAAGEALLDVEPLAPFRVVFLPIESTVTGQVAQVDATNMGAYLDTTRTHLAVAEVDPSLHSVYTTEYDLGDYQSGWLPLLNDLLALRFAEGATDEYYHGMVPRAGLSPPVGGVAYVPGSPGSPYRVGLSLDAPFESAKETVAHELGHNLGLRHAPGCGAGNPDPGFPTTDGSLEEVGYDIDSGTLVDPFGRYDFMSYCNPTWVSAYYFDELVDWRRSDPYAGPVPTAPVAGTENILVWGRTSPSGVFVNPSLPVEAPVRLPGEPGPYTVTLIGQGGVVLSRYAFAPVEVAHSDGAAHFAFVLPAVPGGPGAIREVVVSGPRGTAQASQGSPAQPTGAVQPGVGALTSTVPTEGVRLEWDADLHPVVLVRDASTGDVLSFARGGTALVAPGNVDPGSLEVTLPDGRRLRPAVEQR